MSFRLSTEPLPATLLFPEPQDGAVSSFVGIVRNHNEGRPVERLQYEAFDELAMAEGTAIVEEASKRFRVTGVACSHRVGLLEIGDLAIRVDVSSPHRQEAFEACRYVIDEVKRRVPIWKKEHYADGSTDWINCSTGPRDDATYYQRQTILKEVGQAGQNRLRQARVLVVGAGGLGSAALQHLAGAGVGTIGICEFDVLHESNLHRQTLYSFFQCGQDKVVLAAEELRSLNPHINVQTHAHALTPANARSLIDAYDVVLDCTDNFETKFLLNDTAVALGKPLIQASIYQFEGQILFITPDSACLRCVWPTVPESSCVGSCAEVGVLGFVPGVFGAMQAAEAIKWILGLPSPLQTGHLVLLNLLDYSTHQVKVLRNPECPVCGSGVVAGNEWARLPHELKGEQLIDIRGAAEASELPSPIGCRVIEPEQVGQHLGDLPVVLVCHSGARSAELCRVLRAQGHTNVYSLAGGVLALRRNAAGQS